MHGYTMYYTVLLNWGSFLGGVNYLKYTIWGFLWSFIWWIRNHFFMPLCVTLQDITHRKLWQFQSFVPFLVHWVCAVWFVSREKSWSLHPSPASLPFLKLVLLTIRIQTYYLSGKVWNSFVTFSTKLLLQWPDIEIPDSPNHLPPPAAQLSAAKVPPVWHYIQHNSFSCWCADLNYAQKYPPSSFIQSGSSAPT